MWRAIKTFLKDPEPTNRLAEVEPGRNVVDGVVRIHEPLRSPVRGQNCAAYFYRAFLFVTGTRSPQPMLHKLREVEVYAPFTLELEDGELDVVPARRSRFNRDEHQDLARRYGTNFQGVEELVLPGARVRLTGKARREGERLVLQMKSIAVIEKQVVQAGVVGDRKARRKKR